MVLPLDVTTPVGHSEAMLIKMFLGPGSDYNHARGLLYLEFPECRKLSSVSVKF